jgi:hypothetical protein
MVERYNVALVEAGCVMSVYSFRPYLGPGVDSASSENEYQEHLLGVNAAGA